MRKVFFLNNVIWNPLFLTQWVYVALYDYFFFMVTPSCFLFKILSGENVTTADVVIAAMTVEEASTTGGFLDKDPTRLELVVDALESVVDTEEPSLAVRIKLRLI